MGKAAQELDWRMMGNAVSLEGKSTAWSSWKHPELINKTFALLSTRPPSVHESVLSTLSLMDWWKSRYLQAFLYIDYTEPRDREVVPPL